MLPLTDTDIRSSLVNASMRERKAVLPPLELAIIEWDTLDFLGWRDPKAPASPTS